MFEKEDWPSALRLYRALSVLAAPETVWAWPALGLGGIDPKPVHELARQWIRRMATPKGLSVPPASTFKDLSELFRAEASMAVGRVVADRLAGYLSRQPGPLSSDYAHWTWVRIFARFLRNKDRGIDQIELPFEADLTSDVIDILRSVLTKAPVEPTGDGEARMDVDWRREVGRLDQQIHGEESSDLDPNDHVQQMLIEATSENLWSRLGNRLTLTELDDLLTWARSQGSGGPRSDIPRHIPKQRFG